MSDRPFIDITADIDGCTIWVGGEAHAKRLSPAGARFLQRRMEAWAEYGLTLLDRALAPVDRDV